MQLLNKLRATQIRKVEDDSDILFDCRCERHCDNLCICHRQDATNEDDSDDVAVKIEPEEWGYVQQSAEHPTSAEFAQAQWGDDAQVCPCCWGTGLLPDVALQEPTLQYAHLVV